MFPFAIYCVSDKRRDCDKQLSFHSVPTDPIKRKAWIVKIRRDPGPNFKVSASFPHV